MEFAQASWVYSATATFVYFVLATAALCVLVVQLLLLRAPKPPEDAVLPACSRCGVRGIHACTGRHIEPMNPEEQARLARFLEDIQRRREEFRRTPERGNDPRNSD